MTRITRRGLVAGLGYTAIAGTTGLLAASPEARATILQGGEALSYRTHRLIGRDALVREYSEADMSPDFRTNGNTMPQDDAYQRHLDNGFADWALQVDGLVANPQAFPLDRLRSMPSRTQITRHDCVEGWSAIGKWTGVPLSAVLEAVTPMPAARYVVLHCADSFGLAPYYESIDFVDAYHPQTMLAYGMNDGPLPVGHGAPIRLRVERQLGYKHAKFVMRLELVESLSAIGRGKGGFWEDNSGYEWYAGI
ncbi:molybdopterin-binding protein [Pelagovum pacificum]|uniref:Molybdopterin-binding protein n=1 Tax=Pelagovum pacificum TaxID=2588711 RepID=A0A5C5GAX4_9RHOB|nr:molybdopterin-binding protein [Pelagovum pacificum]QQA41301.1 molybdopterin-binding protein [Pelagovum pacificum]TNY31893.1 molybdopterin-binding protein [Pelagovum pacificum]